MRFGRKHRVADPEDAKDTGVDPATDTVGETDPVATPEESAPARSRELPESGPFDVTEVDVEEGEWIDLGSLLLPPPGEGFDLRLQVDETSGEVVSVVLVGGDGALELRAFAASRGGGAWEELRPRIAAEVARQGGTASDDDGRFGRELVCQVPVTGPQGESGTQASRFAGHEGPTWLLRSNLMGRPALEPADDDPWHALVASVVVRRGSEAMAPGTPLPLRLPPEARPVEG